MSVSQVLKGVREIEMIVCKNEPTSLEMICHPTRSWMMTRLSDALQTFLRQQAGSFAYRDPRMPTVGQEVAEAICYPQEFTPDELGRIVMIFGKTFGWGSEKHLTTLLDHMPGKAVFKPAHPVDWHENVRIRLEQVPNASTFDLKRERLRVLDVGVQGWQAERFAQKIGAFGYRENTTPNGFGVSTTFYFDEFSDMVLAKLKYV